MAGGTFVGLVVVGLVGADKPPPVGFLVWVVLAAVVSGVLWWRSPRWASRASGARDFAVLALFAGIVVVAIGGEPTVEVTASARLATIAVVAGLGTLAGWVLGPVVAGRAESAGGQARPGG